MSAQASEQPAKKKCSLVGAVGNFNIQYNLTSASVAVQVLSSDKYLGHPLYPQPDWSVHLTLAVVFAGAMIGMLVMGRLGDVLGRTKALRLTACLGVLGGLIPACAAGTPNMVYSILCFGRLILGIGVGGLYPLTATHSAEEGGGDVDRESGKRAGWSFFWQSPGVCIPYLVALVLFKLLAPVPPEAWSPQTQFRVIFALGLLPGVVVIVEAMKEEAAERRRQQEEPSTVRSDTSSSTGQTLQPAGGMSGIMAALREEAPEVRRELFGTTAVWFVYDVAYYGTAIFTPTILNEICLTSVKVDDKCQQNLSQTALQSMMVASMGIPACLLTIAMLDKFGCRGLNILGFSFLALNFFAMGLLYAFGNDHKMWIFALFCSLTFFLGLGPNVGTYVLPVLCFPARIRSTCHGISAFGGKAGAVAGTVMFPLIQSSLGLPAVLFTQAVWCVVGVFIAHRFLRDDRKLYAQETRSRAFIQQ